LAFGVIAIVAPATTLLTIILLFALYVIEDGILAFGAALASGGPDVRHLVVADGRHD
jgi:hypothetical protein